MTHESNSSMVDAETLAASVRSLATDAHRLLNRPDIDPLEFRTLTRRISALRRQVPGGPSGELARWLDSLRRRMEACHPSAGTVAIA